MESISTTAGATDYRSFFERSPVMMCTARLDAGFVDVNEAFATALGYATEELSTLSIVDVAHPEVREWTAAAVERAVAARSPGASFENRCSRADGSTCWLCWDVRVDSDERLLYCSIRDVTDVHEHADVVAKLLAELERSNTDLAQFAYVASHDLSEPLRMVSSYVQLLADRYAGQLDDDADEFIGFAVDGASRMKILIDDLLAYSRAGGGALIRRRVDCGALVTGALADLDRAVDESGADVVVGDLPVVVGDPGQLALLFQNLLSNALKFVAEGVPAQIRVCAERLDEAWCFSVQDNGIGIAELHRERIFLMFKRLHGRSEYPGTGIGLALCHKIVSRLGGRIWLEAAATGGSVFRFTLPDVRAETVAVRHV